MPFDDAFIRAARDYRALLDGGYPADASRKLVGDRHRLDRADRMALFRGVLSAEASDRVRARLVERIPDGTPIAIDGYNVLFTVYNFRRGVPLFLATDGLLRDSGGVHGRVVDDDAFGEAISLVVRHVSRLSLPFVSVALDAPVSRSAEHATLLRTAFADAGVKAFVTLETSADRALKDVAVGLIASSDSAVAAASAVLVFDLARRALEAEYGASFPDFAACVRGAPVLG